MSGHSGFLTNLKNEVVSLISKHLQCSQIQQATLMERTKSYCEDNEHETFFLTVACKHNTMTILSVELLITVKDYSYKPNFTKPAQLFKSICTYLA